MKQAQYIVVRLPTISLMSAGHQYVKIRNYLNKNNCSDRFPKVLLFPRCFFTGRRFRNDSLGSPNKFEASRAKSMGACATCQTFLGCLSYMKEITETK